MAERWEGGIEASALEKKLFPRLSALRLFPDCVLTDFVTLLARAYALSSDITHRQSNQPDG